MRLKLVGYYRGKDNAKLNLILKQMYEEVQVEGNIYLKQKMNRLRKILGINNFLSIARSLDSRYYTVLVFEGMADNKTIGTTLKDENGTIYAEM